MADLAVGGIIILILGFSISRIVIAKKKGIKCIGCDASSTCNREQSQISRCCSGCDKGATSECQGCNSRL